MGSNSLTYIFISTAITNNFVVVMFLGICPFLGVSNKLDTAWNMGLATTFVLVITAVFSYFIDAILVATGLEFLRLIAYIAVIASTVQLVEMILKKFSPVLFRALGIYLPLITTNCAVLGVALLQTKREYDFIESSVFGFAAGVGFTIALVLMASIREQLALTEVPAIVSKGAIMTLMVASLLSMTFMGFAGLNFG
ncbi:MAG: electron transport complex subunit A [Beggiatoa sp. IS2]|nr:MAG: electron transport complex subunit A [Beggiatoa sp. IS2]